MSSHRSFRSFRSVVVLLALVGVWHGKVFATPYPILFVTQVPLGGDFTNVASTFGSQQADMQSAPRGGDLWIRYPDGTLKNLTAAAGYGSTDPTGFQGTNAIAVRDPSMYWDGTKAVFSMIVGGTPQQYQWLTFHWQLYEISGLGSNQTPVITKVPNQPAYNNVSPTYGTDDRIIFASDRPRGGAVNLYPQLDEYEEAPTTSGLWSLDPTSGDLKQLTHAPSGDFTPMVDSFGRVVFTQWDHLQRDQQADADANFGTGLNCDDGRQFGTFNYSSEAVGAPYDLNDRSEIFPEPRSCRGDLLTGTPWNGFEFNVFFPWTVAEDGSAEEIINHLGRHELLGYIPAARHDDPAVFEYYGQLSRFNPNPIQNFLEVKEDPTQAGRYFGVDAPEFGTHAAGQVISVTAPPSLDADHISITYVTHRDTSSTSGTANNSGHYRDPLPLSDGTMVVSHTSTIVLEGGNGSPQTSTYSLRLKTLTTAANGFQTAGATLTNGITKTVSYWDPDHLVTFSGTMWELNPVEVRARTRPVAPPPALPAPEQQMFDTAGVSVTQLRTYLTQNNLALIVSRNVTTRDDFDKQQPYNLRVPGGVQTTASGGKIYDVSFLQLLQGDLIRGLTGAGGTTPKAGRRILAQTLHDASALAVNPSSSGPAGSVALASDGSMAAFVPARRAM
ncbi:MAG TPA: hypothetical protein VMT89_06095, partial [Candidatus Acidoferrales bacterium]|nr:hypothetical protein [Candidatus Acidoferrales bacterium]